MRHRGLPVRKTLHVNAGQPVPPVWDAGLHPGPTGGCGGGSETQAGAGWETRAGGRGAAGGQEGVQDKGEGGERWVQKQRGRALQVRSHSKTGNAAQTAGDS